MAKNLIGISCYQNLIFIGTERIVINGSQLLVIFGITKSGYLF